MGRYGEEGRVKRGRRSVPKVAMCLLCHLLYTDLWIKNDPTRVEAGGVLKGDDYGCVVEIWDRCYNATAGWAYRKARMCYGSEYSPVSNNSSSEI